MTGQRVQSSGINLWMLLLFFSQQTKVFEGHKDLAVKAQHKATEALATSFCLFHANFYVVMLKTWN